jgi:hypothetical protein
MFTKYFRFILIGVIVGLFVGVSVRQAMGQATSDGITVANGNALVANGSLGVKTIAPLADLDVVGTTLLRGKTVVGGSGDPATQTNVFTTVGKINATEGYCINATCITATQLAALGGTTVAPPLPRCGSAADNRAATFIAPSTNLCNPGVASSVTPETFQNSPTWNWDCISGTAQIYCHAPRSVTTNAVCGSANRVQTTTQPTTNLCNPGNLQSPPGVTATATTWNWTCVSTNGGNSATCSAPKTSTSGAPTPNPNATVPRVLSFKAYRPAGQSLPQFEIRYEGVTNWNQQYSVTTVWTRPTGTSGNSGVQVNGQDNLTGPYGIITVNANMPISDGQLLLVDLRMGIGGPSGITIVPSPYPPAAGSPYYATQTSATTPWP